MAGDSSGLLRPPGAWGCSEERRGGRAGSYLNADLGQIDLHGQLLAAVHVGVVGLFKGTLQLVKLVRGEGGAVSPVFFLGLFFVRRLPLAAAASGQLGAGAAGTVRLCERKTVGSPAGSSRRACPLVRPPAPGVRPQRLPWKRSARPWGSAGGGSPDILGRQCRGPRRSPSLALPSGGKAPSSPSSLVKPRIASMLCSLDGLPPGLRAAGAASEKAPSAMASGLPGGCMRRPARGSAAPLQSHPAPGRRGQVWHGVAGRAGLLGAGEECRGAVGEREGEAPARLLHGGGGRASLGPRRLPRPADPGPGPSPRRHRAMPSGAPEAGRPSLQPGAGPSRAPRSESRGSGSTVGNRGGTGGERRAGHGGTEPGRVSLARRLQPRSLLDVFTAAARKLPRGTIGGRLRGAGVRAAVLVLCGTPALRPLASKGTSQTRCFWTGWTQEVGSAFQTSQGRGSSEQYLRGSFPVCCYRTESVRRVDSVTLHSTVRVGLGW